MRYLVLTAIALGVAAMPAGGHAEAGKKIHKYHIHKSQNMSQSRAAVGAYPDPAGGNAAAGGNNANSMDGSNSAVNNAEGRTSGGGRN
jgi:hypothetical protein